MKRAARLSLAAYVLAIMVAGMAPHCGWMFPAAAAAPVHVMTPGHGAHAGHRGTPQPPAHDADCAAMELAKSVGPLPGTVTVAAPNIVSLNVIVTHLPGFAPRLVTSVRQPRGPPWAHGGFAAVFAANHRLLI